MTKRPVPNSPAELTSRQTLSIEEASRALGISRASAYRAARSGEIPVIRVGNRILVPKTALRRFLGSA